MRKILIILVTLAVLALPVAAAAEGFVWLTDSKTGCQVAILEAQGITNVSVSWSGSVVNGKAEGPGQLVRIYELREKGKAVRETMEGTAEMRQGVIHGQVSLRWSDGMTYEGGYENGLRSGFGKTKLPSGKIYEGEWKDGVPHGKGIERGPSGRVIYDGLFEKGAQLCKVFAGKVAPSIDGLLDAFQGQPWGASEDAVKAAYKNRDDVFDLTAGDQLGIKGMRELKLKLRDMSGAVAKVGFVFVQDKLYSGDILWQIAREDELLAKYESVKATLVQKYGSPDEETGKFLDKKAKWYFGVAGTAANSIEIAIDTAESVNAAGQKVGQYYVTAYYQNGALFAFAIDTMKKVRKGQGLSL